MLISIELDGNHLYSKTNYTLLASSPLTTSSSTIGQGISPQLAILHYCFIVHLCIMEHVGYKSLCPF
jgi:hypothetical protein